MPRLASYTLALALQLRKKHGKISVRVAEECQLAQGKQNMSNVAEPTVSNTISLHMSRGEHRKMPIQYKRNANDHCNM